MIAITKRTPIYKKTPDDFRIRRKLRFFFLRILKILQIILFISAIIFLSWIWYFDGNKKITNIYQNKTSEFFYNNGLKLSEISISGNEMVSHKEIIEIIKDSFKGAKPNIINLDLDYVSNEILKNGWVKEISIKKNLPNNLEVMIIEREPEAILTSPIRICRKLSQVKIRKKL